MTQPPGSPSQRRSPWNAEEGNAWWLLCHDSQKVSQESHQTLRDSSPDRRAVRSLRPDRATTASLPLYKVPVQSDRRIELRGHPSLRRCRL